MPTYRVLKFEAGETHAQPHKINEFTDDRQVALTDARTWVQERSGRVAHIVVGRDTLRSGAIVEHSIG